MAPFADDVVQPPLDLHDHNGVGLPFLGHIGIELELPVLDHEWVNVFLHNGIELPLLNHDEVELFLAGAGLNHDG